MAENVLNLFSDFTKEWFERSLGTPTEIQKEAWPAINSGQDTLVSAPTGTGKTLSAFLVFIDRLKRLERENRLERQLYLIYISPLKSLAGDIRENLRRPLDGITDVEASHADETGIHPRFFGIDVAIRTGDTDARERRKMIKTPPHILITTPESLYLLITSESGKKMLKTANAVIIDELHAVIDTKRGAHLSLSLARLDKLCGAPLQRIGLSATIEPLERAAVFLSPNDVKICAPKMKKKVRIEIISPFFEGVSAGRTPSWQDIANTVYSLCREKTSVLAFVEGRIFAEKLAYYVNLIGGESFARTHHGCLSKEQRFEVENLLRKGELRLLCATSSMELGIDVGDIEQVIQVGCPFTVSGTLQRLGRAGHNPNRESVMYMIPQNPNDTLFCGLTAEIARRGGVEDCMPPKKCFDVLSQHLVSMAAGGSYTLDEIMELTGETLTYKDVTRDDVRDILGMLSGDYEHKRDIPVRPRLIYDRINEVVEGDNYSRMLAISSPGTIPDTGMFTVKTEKGVKVGEVDEEFTHERRTGDKFMLGTFAWQIVSIDKDTVVVRQTNQSGAMMPFWKNEWRGRGYKTGVAFGKILKRFNETDDNDKCVRMLMELGLDARSAASAFSVIDGQKKATKVLPDDKTIIIENTTDQNGTHQLVVHSIFARKINAPLALLMVERATLKTGSTFGEIENDSGFMLYSSTDDEIKKISSIIHEIDAENARRILEARLISTPAFNMTFRYNCARALMMGVKPRGRQPLWLQRIRSAELLNSVAAYDVHPLMRETKRECIDDLYDIDGLLKVLHGIESGEIKIIECTTDKPSPLARSFQWEYENNEVYDYFPSTYAIDNAAETALGKIYEEELLSPDKEKLDTLTLRTKLPKSENELHTLLMIEGDITPCDLDIRSDVLIKWLENLAHENRALYIEPGLWIAKEHESEYSLALEEESEDALRNLIRRLVRYKGAKTAEMISERFFINADKISNVLEKLVNLNEVVLDDGFYYHGELYKRAREATVKSRRNETHTLPASMLELLTLRKNDSLPEKSVGSTLRHLLNISAPIFTWENIIFTSRIKGYSARLLDDELAKGEFFWKISDEKLSFHLYDDIDWDADLEENISLLDDDERIIYSELLKRGASFIRSFSSLLGGKSPHTAITSLMKKGLITADSFVPVRQIAEGGGKNKSAKSVVNSRTLLLTSGRFDLVRPLRENADNDIKNIFNTVGLISRESSAYLSLNWKNMLEKLRIMEYTDRARRGYFFEGLSGAQFMSPDDFKKLPSLKTRKNEIHWIGATDPIQLYGKILPHESGREFMNLSGTYVGLYSGRVMAVLEKGGKTLRVFEKKRTEIMVERLLDDFNDGKILPSATKITLTEYDKNLSDLLKSLGFQMEMQYLVYFKRR